MSACIGSLCLHVGVAVAAANYLGAFSGGAPGGGGGPTGFSVTYVSSEVAVGQPAEELASEAAVVESAADEKIIHEVRSPEKKREQIEPRTVSAKKVSAVPKVKIAAETNRRESAAVPSSGFMTVGLGFGQAAGQDGIGVGTEGRGAGSYGAQVIYSPKPPYPRLARLAGFEGRVVLEVEILADGRVKEARIAESSGRDDCDTAASRTLMNAWRFEPAKQFGVPVASQRRVAVQYVLR